MNQTTRRTAQQWQSLVAQWQRSGLSMARFCEDHDVGYASFCYWRKRLAEDNQSLASEASFVDLGALASSGVDGGWHIVLSLGNGVELRLRQG